MRALELDESSIIEHKQMEINKQN